MFDKLKSFRAEQKAFYERLKKEGEAALREAVSEFLDAHPEVAAIHWKQQIPYFNDGDACVFYVEEPQLYILDETDRKDMEEGEYTIDEVATDFDYKDTYEVRGKVSKKLIKDFDELSGLIQNLDDIVQEAYGEHAKVYMTRNSVFVERYTDHD